MIPRGDGAAHEGRPVRAPGRVCDECTAGVDAMFQEDPVSCWRTARLLIGAALGPIESRRPLPARCLLDDVTSSKSLTSAITGAFMPSHESTITSMP